MSKKKIFQCFLVLLIIVGSIIETIAYDPNWEEHQRQNYIAIGLKSGDVVNAENWQKVNNCLPPSVVEWVKKGEFEIELGEFKYDYSNDEAYDQRCLKNEGKYAIGDRDQIVEKATGKIPTYVDARPFPVLDILNDPQAGLKLIHNSMIDRFRPGCSETGYDIQWISDRGFDRYLQAENLIYYFWVRPDGKALPNPQKVKRLELVVIKEPFDLSGAAILNHYWLDGSPERFVQYIPAIRRIKKMNSTDRSSPFFGTDFSSDDGAGFNGQPESMEWKFIEEKIILAPHAKWNLAQPDIFTKEPNGSWKSGPGGKLEWGYENPEKKYNVAWQPLFVKWVPRKMYVLSMSAKDPYYAYGDQLIYIDAEANNIVYKIIWDKSGQYWKTLVVNCDPAQWGGNRSMTLQVFYIAVDDKTHHASACDARGKRGKYHYYTIFGDPANNTRIYKDEYIATMGR